MQEMVLRTRFQRNIIPLKQHNELAFEPKAAVHDVNQTTKQKNELFSRKKARVN